MVEHRAFVREIAGSNPGRTNTQGLVEKKSNRRPRLTTFPVNHHCGALKNAGVKVHLTPK